MRKTTTALVMMGVLASVAAHAEDNYDDTQTAAGKPTLSIGAGVAYIPEYSGADSYKTRVIPMVAASKELTPGNTLYLKGFQAGLDHAIDKQLTVGLLGNYRFGRDADDSDKLAGMGDIDGAFEMGPKVRYQLNKQVGLEAQALFDVSGAHEGYTARVGGDYMMPLSQVTFLSVKGGLNYGSEDFNNTYYGVKSSQARAGRAANSPDSGFTNVDASVGVKHVITQHVSVNGNIGADYLIGDVADSSLVEEAFQPKAMVGVTYTF